MIFRTALGSLILAVAKWIKRLLTESAPRQECAIRLSALSGAGEVSFILNQDENQ